MLKIPARVEEDDEPAPTFDEVNPALLVASFRQHIKPASVPNRK